MSRLIFLLTALLFAAGAPTGLAVALPPEKAVALDFSWLAPPVIAPSSAWGNVVRVGEVVRLSSRPGSTQPSYAWTLRYPISIDEYPVLVLRYRASRIGLATEPVLVAELSQGGVTVPVAHAGELSQDGSVQELRKDLRPLPPRSAIGRVRFTLPPAVSRLDVIELRFEPASDMPGAKVPMRQDMQFAIVDEYNRPVADAVVIAGPLERANWTAEGRTDANGRVSLAVISPPAPGQAAGVLGLAQPTEAAVMRQGYSPQYISSVHARPGEVLAVRLARTGDLSVEQPVAAQPAAAQTPPAPQPAAPVEETPEYATVENHYYYEDDDDDEYYDYGYDYGRYHSPYGYWPGYVVVVVSDNDKGHGHHGDGTPLPGHGKGDLGDQRTPPPPLPPAPVTEVPWQTTPRFGVTSTPRYGVTSTPTFGVTSVPRYGVIPAPAVGVSTAPGTGFRAVQGTSAAPPAMNLPRDITPNGRSVDTRVRNVAPVQRTPSISRPAPRSNSVAQAPSRYSGPSRDVSRQRSTMSAPRVARAPSAGPSRSSSRVQMAPPAQAAPRASLGMTLR